MTWCPKCQADVKPQGRGQCPRCGRVLKQSFLARRHPVNKLRRQQLLDKLVADYRPTTTMLLATCEHLAGILEQLETLKPGSPDHQRLVQLSQQLGAALEQSRPAPPTPEDLGDASLDQLAERAAKLNEFIAELQANRDMREAEAAYVPTGEPTDTRDAGRPVMAEGGTREELPEPTSAPAPERCAFCHRPATQCEVIIDAPAWLGEHLARPDVKAHLEAQAAERHRLGWDFSTVHDPFTRGAAPAADDPTAVMLRQIGKKSPWLD